MTDNNYTHISFLLDRSGSMQSIKTDTEGGFKSFIETQAAVPGRCTVTLAQFDNEYEELYRGLDIHKLPALSLQPRGSTALLDSIARLVQDTGAYLSAMPEKKRPGTVIVGIMTDGMENSSKEWTHAAIKALIEEQEEKWDWTISYMGANQDAIEVGAQIGIAQERSLTYAAGNVEDAMSVYAESSTTLRNANKAGMSPKRARAAAAFSPAQRDAAAGNSPRKPAEQ